MCFSLGFLEYALIWLVILIMVVALIRLVFIPMAATVGPWGPTLVQALNIVLWAVVAIAIILLAFDLFACLLGSVPRLR